MYTWTEEKDRDNKQKHGFYFSDILDVFDDPHLLDIYDGIHSLLNEDRYITIGCFQNRVILAVVNTETADGNTRLISAREATPKEKRIYYDNYRKRSDR